MSAKGSKRSAWSDELPVDRIDRDAFLYMGSDPCWSPQREFKRTDSGDVAPGECQLCGGVGSLFYEADGSLGIWREIPSGSHRICARCMRYGQDPRIDEVEVGAFVEPLARPEAVGYVTRDGVTVPERYARLLKG